MSKEESTVKGEYPPSGNGNFYVKDAIPIPHPYCITPKHVAVAADHYNGLLGESAIIGAEKEGAVCDICRERRKKTGAPILSFKEHETALLVACKAEIGKDANEAEKKELHDWLLSIKDEATRNGYAGFAFIRHKDASPA